MVARNRKFAAVVIFTLALGIGGNTAVFSVVNNVFLRALPFKDSDRLVRLRSYTLAPDGRQNPVNVLDRYFLVMREQSKISDQVVALTDQSRILVSDDKSERITCVDASSGWMDALGVGPIIGRGFTAEEERLGSDSGVVVIAHEMWQSRYGGSPAVLGKAISIDNRSYTIVGVMGKGFRFPYNTDAWIPTTITPTNRNDYAVFMKLKPGFNVENAKTEMTAIAAQIKAAFPQQAGGDYGIEVVPIRESLIREDARVALLLLAVVGLFLLLACVNVANLLLARSVVRQRELAIRAALGASRLRQVQQLLTEGLVLSIFGSAGGLLLTMWLGNHLTILIPTPLSEQLNLGNVGVDFRVLGFTLLLSMVAGVVSSIAPALRTTNPDLQSVLKEGGRAVTGSGNRRLLSFFVVSEIALASVLLISASLMLQKFNELQHLNLGFNPDKLLTMEISFPDNTYPDGDHRRTAVNQILQQSSQMPGVSNVGIITMNPLRRATWSAQVLAEGQETAQANSSYTVNHRLINPGLLQAMGIPMLSGRDFTDQDLNTAPRIVIVSKSFARHFWPNDDPLGKRVRAGPYNSTPRWLTVVGVVGDIKESSEYDSTWYLPYSQNAGTTTAAGIHLMVRSNQDLQGSVQEIQNILHRIDKDLVPYDVSTMNTIYTESLSQNLHGTAFIAVFAVFGLILVSLGIYGVMSYVVGQRINEIGIRMAIGAQTKDILWLIARQGMSLTLVGVGIGLVAAFIANRTLSHFVSEINAPNLLPFALASLVITIIAAAACYLPVRRAVKVDPLVALRCE